MKKTFDGNIQATVSAIRKARHIFVACHVNPDGDTIGCLLALGLSFLQMGKKVTLLSQDGVPPRFRFLPGSELITTHAAGRADAAIAVDCGSVQQLGSLQATFFRARTTIQIDHHDFGVSFGKIQLLEEEASAVGEIVYELIRALGVDITPAIATCLLTSIIVDTGAFRFSNIRAKTFDICGRLIKKGVDLERLIEESYWRKSRATARLCGFCLLNAEFSVEGAVAWSTANQKDFKRFSAKIADVDAVADDLRSIEGVKIAVFFRETENNHFRVSLRSRQGINVASVATLFGGGGHHNSAGCLVRKAEKAKLLRELGNLIQ